MICHEANREREIPLPFHFLHRSLQKSKIQTQLKWPQVYFSYPDVMEKPLLKVGETSCSIIRATASLWLSHIHPSNVALHMLQWKLLLLTLLANCTKLRSIVGSNGVLLIES